MATDKRKIELLLQILLNKSDIKIYFLEVNKRGFYIKATDENNTNLKIELMYINKDVDFKKIGYYMSVLQMRASSKLDPEYESYLICITEKDAGGCNKPVYNVEFQCEETKECLNDGSHILLINGEYRNTDSEIGKLIYDFNRGLRGVVGGLVLL